MHSSALVCDRGGSIWIFNTEGGEKEKERDKDVSLEYRLMSWDFCVAVGLESKMEIETVKLL